MKWTISINQVAIIEAGFDFDLVDGAIFGMLSDYTNLTICPKKMEENLLYFNVPYSKVIEEIPMAGLKNNDSVYRRLKKLEQFGVLSFHAENKKKKEVWFRWDRNYDLLVFKKKTGLKSDVNELSVTTSDFNPNDIGWKSGLTSDGNPTHTKTIPITNPNKETANALPLPEKIEIEPSKDPADKRHEWTPQAEDLKAKGIAAKAAGEAEEKLTTLRNKYNAVRAKIRTEENIDLVIQHLNRETEMKRGFDIESATYRATVRKRLQKNTVEEILAVTTFKCKKWKNDSKMRCQLKPSVLYNGHFEEYLVEIELDSKPIIEKPKNEIIYTSPAPRQKTPDYVP